MIVRQGIQKKSQLSPFLPDFSPMFQQFALLKCTSAYPASAENSNILTIPDSFGLGVEFVEKEGPVFNNPINSSSDINNLNHFDPES